MPFGYGCQSCITNKGDEMVTKEQAMTERVFHLQQGNRCLNWRRNGKTQLWKTRPDDFRTPIKFGLYNYDQLTPANAHLLHVESECPNAPER